MLLLIQARALTARALADSLNLRVEATYTIYAHVVEISYGSRTYLSLSGVWPPRYTNSRVASCIILHTCEHHTVLMKISRRRLHVQH